MSYSFNYRPIINLNKFLAVYCSLIDVIVGLPAIDNNIAFCISYIVVNLLFKQICLLYLHNVTAINGIMCVSVTVT